MAPDPQKFSELLARYRDAVEKLARAKDGVDRAERELRDLVYGVPASRGERGRDG
jgi:hypothetical protein